MIEIMNLRFTKLSEPYDFYCDRRTPLGNEFIMRKESERDVVCDAYDNYFPTLINNKKASEYLSALVVAYRKYGKLRIFCWCAPRRCHLSTIKTYLESLEDSS